MVWLYTCFLAMSLLAADNLDADSVRLRKENITVGNKKIFVEIAETDEQRTRGLMFRKSMPENQGMLFVFDHEQSLSFWMKNTFIDLSIGYFDKNRTLVDIQEMKKAASVMDQNLPTYTSKRPAKYALEMNKAWFKKNKIKLGSRFEWEATPRARSKSTEGTATK